MEPPQSAVTVYCIYYWRGGVSEWGYRAIFAFVNSSLFSARGFSESVRNASTYDFGVIVIYSIGFLLDNY